MCSRISDQPGLALGLKHELEMSRIHSLDLVFIAV